MAPPFNQEFIDDVTRRLQTLPADQKPLWGSLTAPGVLGHLTEAIQYSLGQIGDIPMHHTFFSRNIIRPLVLNGIVTIPKGVTGVELPFEAGDLDTLKAAMNDFHAAIEQNNTQTKAHPLFGPITLKEWTNFHVLHFQHHLKQFDL